MQEKMLEKVDKLGMNDNTKDLFRKQIKRFFCYNGSNINRYSVGDEVLLTQNSLITGTRMKVDDLNIIKSSGLISPEFYSDEKRTVKKPYVVEFWNIEKSITLKEFIDVRAGVTIEVSNRDFKTKYQIMCSLDDISKIIENLGDYLTYTIYQNHEQRFVPNKYYKDPTMAFIVTNDTEEKNEILKNNLLSKDFDRNMLEDILPESYIEKYIDGCFNIHETGRENMIIFGVPSSFIEGIIVCDDIKSDVNKLTEIKSIFSDCYICDINGVVLIGNK